jgi:hypothetical protein
VKNAIYNNANLEHKCLFFHWARNVFTIHKTPVVNYTWFRKRKPSKNRFERFTQNLSHERTLFVPYLAITIKNSKTILTLSNLYGVESEC